MIYWCAYARRLNTCAHFIEYDVWYLLAVGSKYYVFWYTTPNNTQTLIFENYYYCVAVAAGATAAATAVTRAKTNCSRSKVFFRFSFFLCDLCAVCVKKHCARITFRYKSSSISDINRSDSQNETNGQNTKISREWHESHAATYFLQFGQSVNDEINSNVFCVCVFALTYWITSTKTGLLFCIAGPRCSDLIILILCLCL